MSAERVGRGGGGGGGGGGGVHPKGANSMAVSGLGYRKALVGTRGHFCHVLPSHLHSVGVVRITEVHRE